MKVQIEVLRMAVNKMLDQAVELYGDVIEIDADLYWFVPKDMLNDMSRDLGGLTIGSLEVDWSEVAAIAHGLKNPFGYGLVWASSILRAVGDRV